MQYSCLWKLVVLLLLLLHRAFAYHSDYSFSSKGIGRTLVALKIESCCGQVDCCLQQEDSRRPLNTHVEPFDDQCRLQLHTIGYDYCCKGTIRIHKLTAIQLFSDQCCCSYLFISLKFKPIERVNFSAAIQYLECLLARKQPIRYGI